MGLAASLKVIPAALFKRHKDDLAELEVPADVSSFWLDKAWAELHTAMREMPKPLCLAVMGDHPVCGRLDGGLLRGSADELDDEDEDRDDDDEEDCYIGYASPALVKRLHSALDQLSDDELLTAIKSAGWPCRKSDQRNYRASFAELKSAYRTAAESGAAVMVVIT